MSYHMRQKHRCLAKCTRYYGNWYIISGYGLFWFLCARYYVYPPPPPPTLRANSTYVEHTLMYVMELAVEK